MNKELMRYLISRAFRIIIFLFLILALSKTGDSLEEISKTEQMDEHYQKGTKDSAKTFHLMTWGTVLYLVFIILQTLWHLDDLRKKQVEESSTATPVRAPGGKASRPLTEGSE